MMMLMMLDLSLLVDHALGLALIPSLRPVELYRLVQRCDRAVVTHITYRLIMIV